MQAWITVPHTAFYGDLYSTPNTTYRIDCSHMWPVPGCDASGYGEGMFYMGAGKRVAVLIDEPLERGVHTIEWDDRNNAGHDLPSGIYTYTVEVNDFGLSRKMTLNR